MSEAFRTPLTGYRLADTQRGDTLQRVALRELGDAARWYDLAALNNLIPPYLTDDAAEAGPRVKLTGAALMVPSAAPSPTGVTGAADVFGADLALPGGLLAADAGGDLAGVAGVPNLVAAIEHRFATDPGELLLHPDYGAPFRSLVGTGNRDINGRLAVLYGTRALRADPRIDRVEAAAATVTQDRVEFSATAVTVDGKRVPAGNNTTGGIVG